MVGSVIVYENKIIGEGFHQKYGEAHAEVNAIRSVKDKELLKESTLYVNLEPCCHWGKTPPCAELIIKSGIKNVVIGSLDPNPLVAGKGVKLLQEAGVNVISGILEQDCKDLNQLFFEQFPTNKTVKFILKWAESADGFMGKEKYNSPEERELSNKLTKRFVHKLRSETDAIMVGTNTVLIDNPILDNRYWFGKLPIAIIIDRNLKIPLSSNLFKPLRNVIIFNELKNETIGNIIYCKMDFENKGTFWQTVNTELLEIGITSVLLEGGSKILKSFINSKLTCKIVRIKTNKIWNYGIKAPIFNFKLKESFRLSDNLVELF
jgi:diaminohydroxyphosphoribosylaminopyrimidine deaminase/5-amino-6-(5-phosphoribosylamino)uracil reductase